MLELKNAVLLERAIRPRSSTRLAALCTTMDSANQGMTIYKTHTGQFRAWVRSV